MLINMPLAVSRDGSCGIAFLVKHCHSVVTPERDFIENASDKTATTDAAEAVGVGGN
jgi:hypothetical protein